MRGFWLNAMAAPLIALLLAGPAWGQEVHTQDFDLPSGWSAIYLEVEPELNDPETVFAGCPALASVWTFDPRFGSGGLTPGLGEGLLLRTGWFSYFPSSRPESILTNLFGVRAGRAYLVKIDGAEGCSFSIAGTPLLRRTRWTVDHFTLTGFPVDPISPPSFEAYFAPSPAHAGQPVFRLDPSGEWGVVAGSETIQSGEAYWVFTQAASDYQGPLEVELEISDRIDFGASRTRETLTLHNRLAVQAEVSLTLRPTRAGGVAVPLKRQVLADVTTELSWPDLEDGYSQTAPAEGETVLTLAVDRSGFVDRAEQILEVSNGLGARRLLLVGASTATSITPSSARSGGSPRALDPQLHPFAGLWMGFASVDQVSEVQTGSTTPVPTGRSFELRLLIHVDRAGQARLLKEVIQLFDPPVLGPDPEAPGFETEIEPGSFVLVTDDTLIPSFDGVVLRDGQTVGVRLSTVAYDFDGSQNDPIGTQDFDAGGSFGPDGNLTIRLDLPSDFPTNPFLHRFHPDHDNLDEKSLPGPPEAPAVTRDLTLEFSSVFSPTADGLTSQPPEWGSDTLGGTYQETIAGLHLDPISVQGRFLLRRVAGTPELNQPELSP